jgi:hypothetical protein
VKDRKQTQAKGTNKMLNANQKNELLAIFGNVVKHNPEKEEILIKAGDKWTVNAIGEIDIPAETVIAKVFKSDKGTFVSVPKIALGSEGKAVIALPDGSSLPLPAFVAPGNLAIKERKDKVKYIVGDVMTTLGDLGVSLSVSFNDDFAKDNNLAKTRAALKKVLSGEEDTQGLLRVQGAGGGSKLVKIYELPTGTYEGLTITKTGSEKYPKISFTLNEVEYQVPNKEAKFILETGDFTGTYCLDIPEEATVEVATINGKEHKYLKGYSFYQEMDYSDIAEYC